VNDDIKGSDSRAVVQAGMCTALAVVLSMIGLYMPVFSGIIFMLIPLPIAYLGLKQGVRWSLVVMSGILILDSVFFGIVSAAFLCAIFGLLGVVMGICYHYKTRAAVTLIAGAAVVLAALVGEGLAAIYLLGMPSLLDGSMLSSMTEASNEMMTQMYSGAQLEQAEQMMDQLMDLMKRTMPFAITVAAIFYSWASMTLAKVVFTRMGIRDIPQLPPLAEWKFPRWFLLILLAAIGLQIVFKDQKLISNIMYNVTLFVSFLLWLQGLAVLWWMPRQYKWMRGLRWVIAICSMFSGFLQLIMIMLGVYDMMARYREKHSRQDGKNS
jgi:uncharacterized protein YybS (DUF2232 family)